MNHIHTCIQTLTQAYVHRDTHMCTQVHAHTQRTKPLAAVKNTAIATREPALRGLCTTQALVSTVGKSSWRTHSSTVMTCHEKIGPPYFRSPRSKYIEIFGPPGTKMIEIYGPPLKYFIPHTKIIIDII